MGDNCIEMDGGGRNIRAFDNRCINLADRAFSVQPGYGGPFYWVRNVVYNTNGALKYIEGSSGILSYNNTFIGEGGAGPAQNMHFRNNLFIGSGITASAFTMNSPANTNTMDYDGFRASTPGADIFQWNTPDFAHRIDYDPRAQVKRSYKSLGDFQASTGQEKHGVMVDYDSFMQVAMPAADDPQHVYDPTGFDFRLKPGSPAVDAGIALPNITDGFTGKAPDLGALEVGQPLPHYGPRD